MNINPEFSFLKYIEAVLIDLDNTLYEYQPAHNRALSACYDLYSTLYSIAKNKFLEDYLVARKNVTKRLHPSGACRSRLFAFQKMLENAKTSNSWQLAAELDVTYWNVFIENIIPYQPAVQLLVEANKLKIPVCIVTNMTAHIQIRKILKLGIAKYISSLTTSEEVGFEKPDPKIFLTSLEKLSVKPSNAIMIGDDRLKDIQGAVNCGVRAHYMSASSTITC